MMKNELRVWDRVRLWVSNTFGPREINLYLVRHGETEGNVRRSRYKEVADHAIRLTAKGIDQAHGAGAFLAQRLRTEHDADPKSFGAIRVWNSPYYRTRQTAHGVIYELGQKFDPTSGIITYREDPFLIEQKAGLFDGLTDEEFEAQYPDEAENYNRHKKFLGRIYGTAPLGETRLDVVIRVKQHFRTVIEDYTSRNIRHVVIVSHGLTVRAYEMGWMRYAPEWLDSEKNPGNCWVRHIHGLRGVGYVDEGYIHGEKVHLNDPMVTQRKTEGAEQVYMLAPQRPNAIVPHGVTVVDPFKQRCEK